MRQIWSRAVKLQGISTTECTQNLKLPRIGTKKENVEGKLSSHKLTIAGKEPQNKRL